MGERAGYRVKEKDQVSALLRKQWYLGGNSKAIKAFVTNVATTLLNSGRDEAARVGDGMIALRNDLDLSRLTAAVYAVSYRAPFDSIETNEACDISDHGITEIELVSWNHWKVNHYNITDWQVPVEKAEPPGRCVAVVKFKEGHTLDNGGMVFTWKGPEF